ncbi:MAG: glycogen synthase GlgA [Verrucomicrobia bacterium]|nr:MAG: glycogen synthase GlgA [Verrucomicrobiota bacterium]
MKILLASSEVHPYSKTGGLADMVGALAKTLARLGHQVGLVTPLYGGIRERFPALKRVPLPLDLPLGRRRARGDVWSLEPETGFTIYFVEQRDFYQRSGLYQENGADYGDNAERFIFFSKAIAHLALNLPAQPDVVHLHDWQTGFAALFLHEQQRRAGQGSARRICMTVHNLAYQGVFPREQYALTNLPWEYFTPNGVEFYGQMNCMKAGLTWADVITTVSPGYAREITTEEFGCGLDGLLRQREGSIFGISNGVDYDEWNTTQNPYLKHSFSATHLEGKRLNKLDLQKHLGLPVEARIPVFASIGRLVEQKGMDILLGALEEMLSVDLQFLLLGSGDPAFERAFRELARRFPAQVAVHIGFDQGLAHQIEAGSDFFLMPSRFEPCGLNQMYSLRYGTIPVVRATGGLEDSVIDVQADAERANGIKFGDYSARALAKAIRKALVLYAEPELLHRFRLNAMARNFSWDRTAAEYLKVYRRAVHEAGAIQSSNNPTPTLVEA